jgi:hypothetical protein
MPTDVILKAGTLTSAPAPFATLPAATVATVLKEFGTAADGPINLPDTATNQEILDACAIFAARRFSNYVRNWWRNKQIASSTDAIQKQNPIGEIELPVVPMP